MRNPSPFLLLVLFPILGGGCTGERNGPAPAVRDSAGVAIVESPAQAVEAAPEWRIDLEPVLDIGVVEGDSAYQLDDVTDALRLSDGSVAVADGGSSEIRVYGPDGRFRFAAGGPGEGPGELQRLSAFYRMAGDSLLAYDSRLGRVSVFAPDGGFVRSRLPETEGGGRAVLVSRLADGTMVVHENQRVVDPPETGVHQIPRTYLLLSPAGTTDSLTTLPGGQHYLYAEGNGLYISSLPFGVEDHVTTDRRHVFAASSARFEVRKYAADGRLERRIRVARPPTPVTEEDVERMLATRTASAPDENAVREMRSRIREMELPETMPAFEELEADAAGHLWVREYVPRGTESNDWIVFDPEGAVTGTVTLPLSFEPLEIADDYVLGRWRDELDVEHVRMYELRREGGAEAASAGIGR